VLGFDDEVEAREPAIRRLVRQHHEFARACGRAGVDHMRDEALGCSHPGASRPHDLGAFGDGLGAIGHGGDALRAAGLEHFRNPRHARGDQRRIVDPAVGPGGVMMQISFTPATFAGIVCISTEDGKAPLPRGM
jgi:hypothetical protein